MAKKLMFWKTKGMNKDLSASAFSSEFSFDNRNLRLQTNEGNTSLSWVNEKGTLSITIADNQQWDEDSSHITNVSSLGNVNILGTAVINHTLVLFAKGGTEQGVSESPHDYIYALKYANAAKTTMMCLKFYEGNLNFDLEHPIETLCSYEAEHIQKVYWTDDKNQPRLINIAKWPYKTVEVGGEPAEVNIYEDTSFDFIPTLKLEETVTVEKIFNSNGMFAPGVIQYAFTYYNKYGQESNIFYTTKLFCVAHYDRGASPEEIVNNVFKITITNVDDSFDYIRIYSILRSSINESPYCKRVQDIEIASLTKVNNQLVAVYMDNGTSGETITPSDLLYKGGETIAASTLEQKDNTLFLGNLNIKRDLVSNTIKNSIKELFNPALQNPESPTNVENVAHLNTTTATFNGRVISDGDIPYINTIDFSGLKQFEIYRFGIQFQHATGRWSEPVWLRDYIIKALETVDNVSVCAAPKLNSAGELTLPQVHVDIKDSNDYNIIAGLLASKYKRARLLIAQSDNVSRIILCQGIVNPTVYQEDKRYRVGESGDPVTSEKGFVFGQSDWMFRPIWEKNELFPDTKASDYGGYIESKNILSLEVLNELTSGNGYSRSIEIGAELRYKCLIDHQLFTMHSPELVFDTSLYAEHWKDYKFSIMGKVPFRYTFGDIDILTKTPTIGSASGFVHKSVKTNGTAALVSGLYYEDYLVEDYNSGAKYRRLKPSVTPSRWPVFMWQHNGSINNDITRPTDAGVRSADLQEKKISNYHMSLGTEYNTLRNPKRVTDIQLFSGKGAPFIKIDGSPYMGNVDTLLTPKDTQKKYFAGNPYPSSPASYVSPTFNTAIDYRLDYYETNNHEQKNGIYHRESDGWNEVAYDGDVWIGNEVPELCTTSEPIRMAYSTTPHLVIHQKDPTTTTDIFAYSENTKGTLPIVEITRDYNANTFFGGKTEEALRANTWIPISEPVAIDATTGISVDSNRGDTYYQRFDCLKTYARTPEDINQVVDIASFMVETHINIDGRYDKNRGQPSNLNMSPQNYNLYNPIYSQPDNFFNYKMLNKDVNDKLKYPNQLTWSLSKQNGADVDLWTNMTLASTLELDGDKGKITSLQKFNDQMLCFQDSGISQILYNENTQISTSEGVPIEIANSGKVQGKRYLSNTIGCSNKWSIAQTPYGIYFMDSNEKSIYRLREGLESISQIGGFNSWCKKNIPPSEYNWTPSNFNNSFCSFYDKLNQDVLFVNTDTALAYSEKIGAFSSFYDYENTPFFCNMDDTGIWIKNNGTLWKHQGGSDYCKFFNTNKPYSMTLIGNPEPQLSKIFTNLEFRTNVIDDGIFNSNTGSFVPTLPFDYLEAWNEYQHGKTDLRNRSGHLDKQHHTSDKISALKRKFRIWRCDIPRNNYPLPTTETEINYEKELGVSRYTYTPNDRMNNPWVYLKLMKKASLEGTIPKVEIHDIVMTYFE